MKSMKKSSLIAIGALTLVLGLPSTSQAASAMAATIKAADALPAPAPAITAAPTVDDLVAQKTKIELDLQALYAKLNAVSLRTSDTLDRLTQKGIPTASAQNELLVANSALSAAKQNIDQFPDPVNPKVTIMVLKDSVVKAETNLNNARTHILSSLAALKIAISASAD